MINKECRFSLAFFCFRNDNMKEKKTEFLRMFNSFEEITPELIIEYGFKGILVDLDDTLVEHNYPVPTVEVKAWLESMKKNRIPVCIISNNQKKRMMSFVQDLDVGYFYNAFKPRTHVINSAVGVMNIKRENAVLIGDQLFTDIKAANKAGIQAFLVKPIGQNSTLFIKLKRILERKII